jgi:phospholipase C
MRVMLPALARVLYGAGVGATLVAAAGCSARPGPTAIGSALPAADAREQRAARSHAEIRHIILVIQENRSFNNLFMGFPSAQTAFSGKTHRGKTIALKPVGLEERPSIEHNFRTFLAACDGTGSMPGTNCKMDGFDLETLHGSRTPYTYVPQAEAGPYWTMAREYVLADMMFPAHVDSSFAAHQYLIAAQAQSSVNDPSAAWGCNGKPGDEVAIITQQRTISGSQTPCFDFLTLADELDRAGLSWRFYAPALGKTDDAAESDVAKTRQAGGQWSAYRAINHIRNGPDWAQDVISPQTQFLSDVHSGTLKNMTWIVPSFADSDHPGSRSATGPSWVTAVVNAVGQSKFWKSSVVIVVWDDWGGLYDPVPPPFADYDGDGIRVPMICISPFAFQNKVDHIQYDFGSIARFIENTFGLAQLAASDRRARPIDDGCLNYSQPPRSFVAIDSRLPASYFMNEPPDERPPDSDF